MKVVFTKPALADLDEISAYLLTEYPAIAPAVERRIRVVLERIAEWPESGQRVAGREGVRVVPLLRYPYLIFYRVAPDAVEILHVRHSSRSG
jgi:plasmid stabilization system protein ParE